MTGDLLQRAAAIVGVPDPSSDQLAAWLGERSTDVQWRFEHAANGPQWMVEIAGRRWGRFCVTMRAALAAAVVEVDRIEREART